MASYYAAKGWNNEGYEGLNPCCSGQWPRTVETLIARDKSYAIVISSLNPYCSGQWSRTPDGSTGVTSGDRCLNPYCSGQWSRTDNARFVPWC